MKKILNFDFLLRLVVAIILLQTLYFKFTGAPESVWIFSRLGQEPLGRYLTGIFELLAAILILTPRTQAMGALLSLALMIGAILSHIFVLGLVVQNDGGELFALACTAFTGSLISLILNRKALPLYNKILLSTKQ